MRGHSKGGITRRDLIKSFGPAGLRAHAGGARRWATSPAAASRARRASCMFFKGASFHSPTVTPTTSIGSLPARRSRRWHPHAQDLILFKGMSIHGGSPKTDGYRRSTPPASSAARPATATTTRRTTRTTPTPTTSRSTSRSPTTTRRCRRWRRCPSPACTSAAGAHSDADNVGLGQRYISYRKRQAGDAQYGNAIEPIQDAGQVYDTLMQRVNADLREGLQPARGRQRAAAGGAAAQEEPDRLPPRRHRRRQARARHGLGARAEARRPRRRLARGREGHDAELAALDRTRRDHDARRPARRGTRPTGNGQNQNNCDELAPVADQMIGLIKLAFEWDLTRVVAFTLSGASSGQRWPSQGVDQAHHTLEHSNDVAGLNIMGDLLRREVRAAARGAQGASTTATARPRSTTAR